MVGFSDTVYDVVFENNMVWLVGAACGIFGKIGFSFKNWLVKKLNNGFFGILKSFRKFLLISSDENDIFVNYHSKA